MNREEFFAFQDTVIVPVFVKEMNATLHVRSLSAGEKAEWEYVAIDVNNAKSGSSVTLGKDRMVTARERLVEIAACTADGIPLFQKGDAKRIGVKNANVVTTLYDAAAKLSGISKEDLEDLAKNSLSAADEKLSA
jgi:hypothetical protein